MVESLPVNRIELLQGTLDLMILQTLRWGPQHGHGIGQAIRASSQDAIQVEHGSLHSPGISATLGDIGPKPSLALPCS
jgi:hypothetical protein